jgi:Cd2+/Zn2+-exporting ATPase
VAALAATLAAGSGHPVSRAIAAGLAAQGVPPGAPPAWPTARRGVSAHIDGQNLRLIGWRAAQALGLDSNALAARLAPHQAQGRSVSLLVRDGEVLALLAVADTVKGHAARRWPS